MKHTWEILHHPSRQAQRVSINPLSSKVRQVIYCSPAKGVTYFPTLHAHPTLLAIAWRSAAMALPHLCLLVYWRGNNW